MKYSRKTLENHKPTEFLPGAGKVTHKIRK